MSSAPTNGSRRERALNALLRGDTVSAAARESKLSRQHLHKLITTEPRFALARQRGREKQRIEADLAERRSSHRLRLTLRVDPETFLRLRTMAAELGCPVDLLGGTALDNGLDELQRLTG